MTRECFAAGLLLLAAAVPGYAQEPARLAKPETARLETIRVSTNIYMLASPQGNVTVQLGEQSGNDGILLVDTLPERMSEKILAEIHKLSDKPIRYIVNSSSDPEHTGSNEAIARTGKPVAAFRIGMAQDGASVLAQENVLTRMSTPAKDSKVTVPSAAWPTLTYPDGRDFYFNGEPVQLFHLPAAHTDGDSIVFFRNSNVISTGEVFITTGYPMIDLARGGSIQGEVSALNRLLEFAVPADNEEGGTLIIPGRGRICDEADLSDYRDMVTIVRDRIAAMIGKGNSLEQIEAAQPTLDYDGRYSTSSWTGDMFTEAIYNSLAKRQEHDSK
jgi:cyclase